MTCIGFRHSEKTKRKMRLAQLGRKHTEETKKKLSDIKRGLVASDETRRKMSASHLGRKLGSCPEERKNNISKAKVGFLRTPKQRRQAELEKGRKANRKLKIRLCEIYGNRCANTKCRWLCSDGTLGCDDISILQLDHIDGGGVRARKGISSMGYYRLAIKNSDKTRYQILCPNCNWLKRVEKKEYPNYVAFGD